LNQLGRVAQTEGNHTEAERHFTESLGVCWDLGDHWSLPPAMEGLAELATAAGQPERAARLFGAAAAVRETLGVPVKMAGSAGSASTRRRTRGDRVASGFAAAGSEGRAVPVADAVAEALAVRATTDGVATGDGQRAAVHYALTRREREVLRLLVQGRTDAEIAVALFISPHTVATHVKRVLAKFGVHSRAAAVAAAFHDGLV
jgi:DNA-binding CsgD family transcriptional regulator